VGALLVNMVIEPGSPRLALASFLHEFPVHALNNIHVRKIRLDIRSDLEFNAPMLCLGFHR
jgi:hypothetical protein